jgi:hypothetical protein
MSQENVEIVREGFRDWLKDVNELSRNGNHVLTMCSTRQETRWWC